MGKEEHPLVVILSRERQTIGTTWKIFPGATLIVHESEVEAYRAAGLENEIWTHTKDRSPAIRNEILNRVGAGNEVVIMDDDIKSVGRFDAVSMGKFRAAKMSGDDFLDELANGFAIARKNDYHLFGVAPTSNCLNYNPLKKIKTGVFINGPMMCIRVTEGIRFDEKIPLKCDYEFTARTMSAKAGVFRLDYLWQDNDFDKLPGGRSCYKRPEDAEVSFYTLMDRYPRYFRENPRRRWEVILSDPDNRKKKATKKK